MAVSNKYTLTDWAREVHSLANTKGWHKMPEDIATAIIAFPGVGNLWFRWRIASYFFNVVGELCELWEAFRAGRLNEPCDKADKMIAMGLEPLTCLEEELADAIIRLLDTAEALGINTERAVGIKHAFNASRSYRHGGKLA